MDRVAERLDRQGFGQTGHAFDQNVPARQERDKQPIDEALLTDDAFAQLLDQAHEEFTLALDGLPERHQSGSVGRGGRNCAGRSHRTYAEILY